MTAMRYYTLHCDADGCESRHCASLDRADLTRAGAAHLGWVHGLVHALSHKTLPAHARPAVGMAR